MKLTDFLTSQPPIDLFAQLQIQNKSPEPIQEEPEPKPAKSDEKENEPQHQEKLPEPEPASEHGEDMDTDDAAHETSIPFVHSGHNSWVFQWIRVR